MHWILYPYSGHRRRQVLTDGPQSPCPPTLPPPRATSPLAWRPRALWEIWIESRRAYGCPRTHAALAAEGRADEAQAGGAADDATAGIKRVTTGPPERRVKMGVTHPPGSGTGRDTRHGNRHPGLRPGPSATKPRRPSRRCGERDRDESSRRSSGDASGPDRFAPRLPLPPRARRTP